MGTDLLLQLLADRAAPIREDVASTARVQAITELETGFVSAAADMTRLGCRYDSWRVLCAPTAALRAYALSLSRHDAITSVVDVLA